MTLTAFINSEGYRLQTLEVEYVFFAKRQSGYVKRPKYPYVLTCEFLWWCWKSPSEEAGGGSMTCLVFFIEPLVGLDSIGDDFDGRKSEDNVFPEVFLIIILSSSGSLEILL
jgi:hypothetical protein